MKVNESDLEYVRNKLTNIMRKAYQLQKEVIELVIHATRNEKSFLVSAATNILRSLHTMESYAEDALDTLAAMEILQEGDKE